MDYEALQHFAAGLFVAIIQITLDDKKNTTCDIIC